MTLAVYIITESATGLEVGDWADHADEEFADEVGPLTELNPRRLAQILIDFPEIVGREGLYRVRRTWKT